MSMHETDSYVTYVNHCCCLIVTLIRKKVLRIIYAMENNKPTNMFLRLLQKRIRDKKNTMKLCENQDVIGHSSNQIR
jgi:hypothetical protein